MPTTPVASYGGAVVDPLEHPELCVSERIGLKPSTTFAAGTLVGEITATPGYYGPYATGNVDGTQNPTHILRYACKTDASSNVTLGDQTVGEWGQLEKGAPAWVNGIFNCADLVGLDAGAVTKLGRLLQGTVSAGRVKIY